MWMGPLAYGKAAVTMIFLFVLMWTNDLINGIAKIGRFYVLFFRYETKNSRFIKAR